ncbi:MAG TPA: SPOR domain-containing protein, partial [Stellaceae bacterium]
MSSRIEIDPEDRQDVEDASPRRRGVIRAAVLSLAVAGLVGGSWWAGHGNKPGASDLSVVPVIHPDTAPVKAAPASPGGMVVPDQDSVLLNHDDKPKFEELLPSPEAVKPRPVAAAPAPAATTPPGFAQAATPSPAVASAAPPSTVTNATPPMPSVASSTPASSPTLAPASPPAAQVATTAGAPPAVAPPAKATPATTAGRNYRLQLGALKNEDAAKQEWLRLQRQQPDVLGKLALTVTRVDLGDRGIYYRIQAGPLADAAAAAQ